jgi:CheY-like chemotaxis protein
VHSTGDAAEALALIRQRRGELDLMLTDVMLGDVHGGELARQALAVAPQLRVVYTSGFSLRAAQQEGMPAGDGFLAKPFRAEDVTRVLDEALAR